MPIKKLLPYLLGLPLLLLTVLMGYFTERTDFDQVILVYGGLFISYILAYHATATPKVLFYFIGIGIAMRLLLVFGMPNLSDDIYRFIWDGRLWWSGLNPFDQLPSTYIEQGTLPPLLNQELYDLLNSPNYFTIYPPVLQGIFVAATGLFPTNILASNIVMKLFLFGFEIGTLLLLWKLFKLWNIPARTILLYALNPLIIIEVVGNLHFEGAMVFFLLLALYWLQKDKWQLSALAFALSVASKLLPLMFLPFLIPLLGWKRSFQYFIIVGVATLFLFVPLFSVDFIYNFGDSLNLYFQKFEFNASLYYLARWGGFQIVGYNLISEIGPALALIAGLSIVGLALFKYKGKTIKTLPLQWLIAICIYLLCTTTVHPWYTSLPLVLCLFTRFRYPVLWTGLIFLTYINYSYAAYFENLWMVTIEYTLVVLMLCYEVLRKEFMKGWSL